MMDSPENPGWPKQTLADKIEFNLQRKVLKVDRRRVLTGGVLTACAVSIEAKGLAQETEKPSPGPAGYSYTLPNLPVGSRLLFQGDSITDMKWGRNEKDRNHYLGHSYVYLIASRLGVDLSTAKLECFNRGMSGHTVSDLKSRWQRDSIEMKPDLLSVLIGVNDVGRSIGKGVPLESWEKNYRFLIESSRQANSKLRLVLLDPFVLSSGRLKNEKSWSLWRNQTEKLGEIVGRIAGDYDAVHIKTQDIFDSALDLAPADHWIWDGVHPLPQGHELIARNWIEAVSLRWP
jgi:lysophospholipase L1-like esterase